ncbi:MAG: tetratricopeptide repeat protein [Maricaulis sp.]|jgi:tetratricopeptide (TPR) repeat protein|nr:tetratricopeptide repeat protein [Maricaulis sp.]
MKNVLRFILIAATALTIASCVTYYYDEEVESSSYGAFLAARYAGVNRDARSAADYYAEALRLEPGDPMLLDRAFITAVVTGDLERGAALAEISVAGGSDQRLASLYLGADLIASRRYDEALEVLEHPNDQGQFNLFMSDILSQWALVGQGEDSEAINSAQFVVAPGLLSGFMILQRAFLFEATGQLEEADAAYLSALANSPFRRMVTEEYGRFLEQNRRSDDARTLYTAFLEATPGEPSLTAALQRVERGGRAPRRLSTSQFAARAGFGPAVWLASETSIDLSVIYLRMLQRLDPSYVPLRDQIAGTLQRLGLPDAALEAYASIDEGPFARGARIDEILLIARQSRMEEATFMARSLVERDGFEEAQLILADLLRSQSLCDEAVGLYTHVINARASRGVASDWRFHYYRGSCLEQMDRWDEAEPDFLTALELSPDEAEVLNYLGYTWIDRGENLEDGFAMIERAAGMYPEAGFIIDSLGWAYYRLANFEMAVMVLERAVVLDGSSVAANMHLGDAYWRVGRTLEAGFQWRHSLDLDIDDQQRADLEQRLQSGLPELAPDDVRIVLLDPEADGTIQD